MQRKCPKKTEKKDRYNIIIIIELENKDKICPDKYSKKLYIK